MEPRKGASPNVKMPPSVATCQYPRPDRVAAMPTTGRFSRTLPMEPRKGASPNVKIPPSPATIQ